MAGKYTRLSYDTAAQKEHIARSTDPLRYKLDPNFAINQNRCFAPHGPRAGAQTSDAVGSSPISTTFGEQADIDSVLRGVTKSNSKSNFQQMPDSLNPYKIFNLPNCPEKIESEYSRYTHPAYDIRGLTVPDLNYDYPLQDPQCQIFENFAVNTRLQAKDTHRTVWQVPLDQRNAFPVERISRLKNKQVCVNIPVKPVL